jgi:hypothetical protein
LHGGERRLAGAGQGDIGLRRVDASAENVSIAPLQIVVARQPRVAGCGDRRLDRGEQVSLRI